MDKSQINLNHFEFNVTKHKHSFYTTVIFVKSKPEYIQFYDNIILNYSFQSESGINQLDKNRNAIIDKLTHVQKRALVTTVHKRLCRAIREKHENSRNLGNSQNHTIPSDYRKNEGEWDWMKDLIVSNSKQTKKPQAIEVAQEDFDFSELDIQHDSEDIPILSGFVCNKNADDFNFDELDEDASCTYSCPQCKSGLLRVEKKNENRFEWVCAGKHQCNSIYEDFRGRPTGEPLNVPAKNSTDENISVPTDDFDFDDDVLSKDFNCDESLDSPERLNDEFNFDEFEDDPEIDTNEHSIEKVFPANFDFDHHSELLITKMIELEKEIYETFKESQRVLEQKNKFQSQFDDLVKKGDMLFDKRNELQDYIEHVIKTQFNTK
ncbi:hypothetical protein [Pseudomonas sp. MB-090624]|uniref:hypothetical protein n=1 Tax=Pseudomonas sp. MB-090624 TaxID=2213078 RepID=UPI0011B55717|nr:hypothetical protein [Pseudomonas sp. MB-090624]